MAYVTSATASRPPVAPLVSRTVETRPADGAHAEYAIDAVTSRVIRLSIAGFWTAPVMADFVGDIAAAVKALACPPEEHLVLCDISGAAIQSQPMFSAFLSLLVEAPNRARRIALVSTNPISRMQARRLLAARDGIALFDDETPAMRWLTADQ